MVFILVYNKCLYLVFIVGTIYIGKAVKYPKIILDGYEYQMHIKELNRTRWRCKYHKKLKCRASLYSTGHTISVYNNHCDHPTENVVLDNLIARNVAIIYNK